eukprot:3691255-Rhodomonas_salina.2
MLYDAQGQYCGKADRIVLSKVSIADRLALLPPAKCKVSKPDRQTSPHWQAYDKLTHANNSWL